jgi:hypothetical protein
MPHSDKRMIPNNCVVFIFYLFVELFMFGKDTKNIYCFSRNEAAGKMPAAINT